MDLLLNVLLALIVKVCVVGGGKILALLQVVLLLLLLGMDKIDCLPGIFGYARIACGGALDDVNTVHQKQPWVRSTTTIATKWEAP